MILGYDKKRPTKENYINFLEKLCEGLKPLEERISLMIYGSYIREDYVPGRSDIDAVLVFSGDLIINKNELSKASHAFSSAQKTNNIPFQVTVTDLRTMQEGTFNSFGPDFRPYFADEKKILVGKDYTPSFTYTMPEHPDLIPLRFNLRKSRTGLFFAEYEKSEDYKKFLNMFNKTLDAVSRASKQILHMIDGNLRKNRFSALEELSEVFPEVDTAPLIKIKELYHNLDDLNRLYFNTPELMKVWNDSVTFFESIVKSYLDRRLVENS